MKTFSKSPGVSEVVRVVPCPVCGGSKFRDLWTLSAGSVFVDCAGCGLVLQNPRPGGKDLAARYDQEYFDYEIRNEEIFFDLMMKGLNDVDFFGSIAPTLPGPPRILDVGCATGRLLKHFKDAGWETAGAELCAASVDYGNRRYGVGITAEPLEGAGFPDERFSAVHASHLIEHVDDPAAFVREVARVLRPGGVFICVTPNIGGLQARLFGAGWRSAIPDHVTLFDKSTLRRLLAEAGFEIGKTKTWGGLAQGSAPGWIKRPMDRWAKIFGFGDVVLMVARKLPTAPCSY